MQTLVNDNKTAHTRAGSSSTYTAHTVHVRLPFYLESRGPIEELPTHPLKIQIQRIIPLLQIIQSVLAPLQVHSHTQTFPSVFFKPHRQNLPSNAITAAE